jgi:hypothetical protein
MGNINREPENYHNFAPKRVVVSEYNVTAWRDQTAMWTLSKVAKMRLKTNNTLISVYIHVSSLKMLA